MSDNKELLVSVNKLLNNILTKLDNIELLQKEDHKILVGLNNELI